MVPAHRHTFCRAHKPAPPPQCVFACKLTKSHLPSMPALRPLLAARQVKAGQDQAFWEEKGWIDPQVRKGLGHAGRSAFGAQGCGGQLYERGQESAMGGEGRRGEAVQCRAGQGAGQGAAS